MLILDIASGSIHFTRPMPRPMPRFILNNIPASRQVCAVVDFSYSALCHALGPRDVRNLYRARATKDRKTSLVASCTWKQTVVFTYSTGLKKNSIIKWFIHKRAPAELFLRVRRFFFIFLWYHWTGSGRIFYLILDISNNS